MSSANLAVFGGKPAVSEPVEVKWPIVTDEDRQAVLAVLDAAQQKGDRMWGDGATNISAFQQEFSEYVGAEHVLYTDSGTAALHMCVAGLGIGAGDEVIVPAFSFVASATCVLHHNAIPVFVDVDPRSGLIDPSRIEAAITERTRAILVVHIHGLSADLDPIVEIAQRRGLAIIEDTAQAMGGKRGGRKLGTIGNAGAFSLNGSKMLTSGEGGLFVTDDPLTFRRAAMLRHFGEVYFGKGLRSYVSQGMGWNYRPTELSAAMARTQLRRLDERTDLRIRNSLKLAKALQALESPYFDVLLPGEGQDHRFQQFVLTLDPGAFEGVAVSKARARLVHALQAEGVPVSLAQTVMLPAQTLFQQKEGYGKGCPWTCGHAAADVNYDTRQYPNAERFVNSYFCVGKMPEPVLAMSDLDRAIEEYVEGFAKVFADAPHVVRKVRTEDERITPRKVLQKIRKKLT